ncbi:MAG: hypothetical protein FD169_2467 [Bacillota bacterium]|nr:MAG: hypothetical protein FD169_2467 [Bacillota bacterium]
MLCFMFIRQDLGGHCFLPLVPVEVETGVLHEYGKETPELSL